MRARASRARSAERRKIAEEYGAGHDVSDRRARSRPRCRPTPSTRRGRRRAWRSTPQVGRSTHEIGSTQAGSTAIGMRSPATCQTGILEEVADRPGGAEADERDAEQEPEHADRRGPRRGRRRGAPAFSIGRSTPNANRLRGARRDRCRARSPTSRRSPAASTAAKWTGAHTSSSSVPYHVPLQRERRRTRSSHDQMPITAAPKDAKTSVSLVRAGREQEEGDGREEERPEDVEEPVEDGRALLFKWIAQPHRETRRAGLDGSAVSGVESPRPQPSAATGCSVTSATYASSSVGSRVVTRPSETPCSRSRIAWVGSWPSAAWTTTTCA